MIYSTESIYIRSATTLKDKISRIDQIIEKLEDLQLDIASNQDINSYSLDDGQTSISTTYRSQKEVEAMIQELEKRREKYVNKLNGHVFRLTPGENFKRRY